MTTQVERHLFTVDDYHVMADAGILTEDDRVQLVKGEIIAMAPIGDRHASCVDRLNRLLMRALDDRAIVRVQNPTRIDDYTEAEPNFMLLAWRDDIYASGHPRPGDVLLLIEVSDATLAYDQDVKLPLYYRAGIPEVWIVDLQSDRLEVYQRRSSEGYGSSRVLESGDSVTPSAFPDISLAVDDIIP